MQIKRLHIILLLLLLSACTGPGSKNDTDTVTAGNSSTTISTDTAKLSKIIDLTAFRPTHAKFKYTFIDNSGQGQRLSVPGPSDSQLEALLVFDSNSFEQLAKKYSGVDYAPPAFSKLSFNFEWLDAATRTELLQSDSNYHGHPDLIFTAGPQTQLWLLKNKVLLVKSTK